MLSTAIQAGGLSSRMGEDKALLRLAGVPLIEHVLEQVQGLTDDLFITTNNPEELAYLHTRLVSDPIPGEGALRGLHTALAAARGDRVLVLACDMPFVKQDFLAYLVNVQPSGDVLIPQFHGLFEPMHAIYRKATCLRAIEGALASGEKKLTSYFKDVQVVTVEDEVIQHYDPDGWSFFNINTPENLQLAEEVYAEFQESEDFKTR